MAPRARRTRASSTGRLVGRAAPRPGSGRRCSTSSSPATARRGWTPASGTGSAALVDALLAPFPPIRAGTAALARLRSVGGLDFVRTLLSPAASSAGHGSAASPRLLLAGNAGHADIPLDAAGSGLMGLLLCMLGQTVGFPVPEGGAGRLTQALASRVRAKGGTIRCSAPVVRILVDRGRATGVTTADGQGTPPAARSSPTWPLRTSTAGWSPTRGFRRGRSGRCAASSSTLDGQGGLGPGRPVPSVPPPHAPGPSTSPTRSSR